MRIPDTYVNNVAERLSLYQDLDNIQDQKGLDEFLVMLADRFGPVPDQVRELVGSFRLRWQAQELGMERLVLKSNKMIGYFISNSKSPFYESPVFTKVLDFMQKYPSRANLSEKNDRLRIIFENVNSLEDAFNKLNQILLSQ